MKTLRTNLFLRSFLLPLAVFLWVGTAACTSWKDPGYSIEQVVEYDQPYEVRVNLADGAVVEMKSPRIESDSLKGVTGDNSNTGEPIWTSIPLSDVKEIEVKKSDAARTAGLVVGVGLLVALTIAAASTSSPSPRRTTSSEPVEFSCPLVYSWDGTEWRLDSGTFGGAIFEPLARTDVDNLAHARAVNGQVRLRLANELMETDHVDALRLLVVDHAPGSDVIPDGSGDLHVVDGLVAPVRARDDHGRDARAAVLAVDGWGWESSPTGRDTAVTSDLRSALELEFDRPPGATAAKLVVHGNNTSWASWLMQDFIAAHGRDKDTWYAAMNADPAAARALGQVLASEAFLAVSIHTDRGWEPRGLVWEAGPEIAKRQALHLDLAGVEGETVRVRLESVPLYWNLDQVGIDFSVRAAPEVLAVELDHAAMEGDGRDVRSLLADADGTELVLETGDAAVLSFQVPPVPDGHARSYLIATTGWYQIHSPGSDAPPRAELARIGTEPLAVSRLSVARLNEALAALDDRAARDRRTPVAAEESR